MSNFCIQGYFHYQGTDQIHTWLRILQQQPQLPDSGRHFYLQGQDLKT